MKLYHTSPTPIDCINGELIFKGIYPPDFLGLHAWHVLRFAKQRTTYSCNDFLYEFEYPIESIKKLTTVDREALGTDKEKLNEIAVKLEEDGGAGNMQYHVVVMDYSLITNWRELYANKDSKYLTGNFKEESHEEELNTNIQSNELEYNSKIKDYAKWFFWWVVALIFALIFDGYIQ
jgi:hypothetical protein